MEQRLTDYDIKAWFFDLEKRIREYERRFGRMEDMALREGWKRTLSEIGFRGIPSPERCSDAELRKRVDAYEALVNTFFRDIVSMQGRVAHLEDVVEDLEKRASGEGRGPFPDGGEDR